MMEQQDLAESFLINFMDSLLQVRSFSLNPKDIKIENPSQMQKSILIPKKIKLEPPKPNIINKAPLPVQTPIKKNIVHNVLNYSNAKSSFSSTEKLNALMRDPYINEIECLGSDSPLIIKKSGNSQKTQISLSVDEIYELIAEFSQKTRIPIINGKIKAALNNLVITAVLSENLGPRFIIQKKLNPLEYI